MKKNKTLNLKNFGKFIEVAISRLENGQYRFFNFSNPGYPLSTACLREFSSPDYSERITSDYGMPSKNNNKDVEKNYLEEIALIEKMIEEYKIPVELAEWQKGSAMKTVEDINKGLNRRNLAIQIWEWYAIPWRYKSDRVYLIWQSHDVMGTPIIKGYPTEYFLKTVSEKFENHIVSQIKMFKQLNFWKGVGWVSIFILIIYILAKIS